MEKKYSPIDKDNSLYADSRDDIAEMWGAKNSSSDYGPRAKVGLPATDVFVEVESVAEGAEAVGGEDDRDDTPVPMPDYIRKMLAKDSNDAPNPARVPLSKEDLDSFNSARREASSSTAKYPPKSRY